MVAICRKLDTDVICDYKPWNDHVSRLGFQHSDFKSVCEQGDAPSRADELGLSVPFRSS